MTPEFLRAEEIAPNNSPYLAFCSQPSLSLKRSASAALDRFLIAAEFETHLVSNSSLAEEDTYGLQLPLWQEDTLKV